MSAVSESRTQFFSVPATAVADPEDQRDMWLWYGDAIEPIENGAFVPDDNGLLEFVPNND